MYGAGKGESIRWGWEKPKEWRKKVIAGIVKGRRSAVHRDMARKFMEDIVTFMVVLDLSCMCQCSAYVVIKIGSGLLHLAPSWLTVLSGVACNIDDLRPSR